MAVHSQQDYTMFVVGCNLGVEGNTLPNAQKHNPCLQDGTKWTVKKKKKQYEIPQSVTWSWGQPLWTPPHSAHSGPSYAPHRIKIRGEESLGLPDLTSHVFKSTTTQSTPTTYGDGDTTTKNLWYVLNTCHHRKTSGATANPKKLVCRLRHGKAHTWADNTANKTLHNRSETNNSCRHRNKETNGGNCGLKHRQWCAHHWRVPVYKLKHCANHM